LMPFAYHMEGVVFTGDLNETTPFGIVPTGAVFTPEEARIGCGGQSINESSFRFPLREVFAEWLRIDVSVISIVGLVSPAAYIHAMALESVPLR
jgi:hypothetical protein